MRSLVVSLLAVLLLMAPCIGHAEAVLLPSVTVTGDTIHLGDLFTDAGANAGDPIAPAPVLGTRVTYPADWLAAIAREHHLDWSPASDFTQTTVERASRIIASDVLQRHLLDAMASAIAGAEAQVSLDNSSVRLLVPAETSDDVAVDGLNLDQRSGRFSATIVAPPGASDAQRLRVTGRLVIEVDVVAVNRAIAINDVIGASDIEKIKLPRERAAADALTDPSQLIGKSARHLLRADQPLRAGDVQDPLVVHKGDLVTIELRTPVMQLSAQGKALEDGAMNVAIRVANTQSNRTIDAIVAGPNLVRAGAVDQLAAR
jgi:flagellar basal body P-ring formation protein FlgA